jgi:hypothetical protein
MGRFLRKLRKKIEEKFPDPSTARDAFEEKKREYCIATSSSEKRVMRPALIY